MENIGEVVDSLIVVKGVYNPYSNPSNRKLKYDAVNVISVNL